VIDPDYKDAEDYSNDGRKIEVPKRRAQGKIVDTSREHDALINTALVKVILKRGDK